MFARLSYSRNLLIQNKLGPLIREPNFHDSFRKTIRYYIFSGIRPPISLSFSQAITWFQILRHLHRCPLACIDDIRMWRGFMRCLFRLFCF